MMEDILFRLKELDIDVEVEGGELILNIPDGLDAKDIIDTIREKKEELVAYILERVKLNNSLDTINKAPEKAFYQLSSVQKRLYFLNEFDKASLAYNITSILKLEGELDKKKFAKVFKGLVDRHESFRTSFYIINDLPVQKISKQVPFEIEYFHSSEAEAKIIIEKFIRPFDLAKAPLIRVGLIEVLPFEHLLMVDMHHIIADGTSQGVLIDDFMTLYKGGALPSLQFNYKDFSEWQQSDKVQKAIAHQKDFWLNEFSEETVILELPTDNSRPLTKTNEGSILSFEIDVEDTSRLKSISEKEGTTMFMVLLSICNVLLGKLSNQEDIVIGTPVAGRRHADLNNIIGMFVNTLPLRNYPKGELSFREFLGAVKSNTVACFNNQDYQYDTLIDELKVERNTNRNPLFDVMFAFQNFDSTELKIPDLKLQVCHYSPIWSKFDITISASENEGKIILNFEYSTQLFKRETIERFKTYLKKIISIVGNNPLVKISAIDLLTQEERQKLLFEFNDTDADFPRTKTIIDLFEQQVKSKPDNTAIIFKKESISYQEFANRVDHLVGYLSSVGVENENIIGVLSERSIDMMVGIYAILKIGAVYLPIDPKYPADRINYILSDSKVKFLLSSTESKDKVSIDLDIIQLANLKSLTYSTAEFKHSASPANLAYVIYTSGSTGNPKGVMIEHGPLVNRLNWMQKQYPIGEMDVVMQKTPIVFDVSVWELFWWSLQGAALYLLEVGGEKDPGKIIDAIEQNLVSTMHFVPSMLNVFLEYIATLNDKRLSSLRQVFSSGEALLPKHVNLFNKTLRALNNTQLINLYGPTEATIDVSYFNCFTSETHNSVPIGKPIDNTKLYILDKYNNLQPIGVAGELCIGGVGLARGYLNNKELTKEKFIPNPFNQGKRLYRTGDLARWLRNGDIEYLGRIDSQVKIRGFRIELGEIENLLSTFHNIQETAVVVRDRGNYKCLVAYYVSEREINVSEIKNFLSQKLPDYMLPSYYVHLNSLPLTNNGKLNRRALPDPEFNLHDAWAEPITTIQKALAEIWCEVLHLKKVGIHSDYFALGGDSIRVIGMVSKINKKLGTNIALVDVYRNNTIEKLSQFLEETHKEETDDHIRNEVLSFLENIKKEVSEAQTDPNIIADVYPMTDIEKGISFYYSSFKSIGIYHDQFHFSSKIVDFNYDRLQKALDLIIWKHESLRSCYNMEDFSEQVRIVHRIIPSCLKCFDISDRSRDEQRKYLEEFVKEDFKNSFNENIAPLWRLQICILNKDNIYVLLTCHHAILDGWSVSSFMVELLRIYHELENNTELKNNLLLCSFKDSVVNELVAKKSTKHSDFWKKELLGYQRAELPMSIQPEGGNTMNVYHRTLNAEMLEQLKNTAYNHDTTLKNICFGAYFFVLKMLSYEQDIVAGCVTNNRLSTEDGEKVLGCFLNTVPVRLNMPNKLSWSAYFKLVDEKLLDIKEHEGMSLFEISRSIGEKNIARNPLFDTLFNFVNFHIMEELFNESYSVSKELNSALVDLNPQQITNTLFDFELSLTGGQFLLIPKYNTAFFNQALVSQFCDYFVQVLECFIKTPEKLAISDNVISEEEKYKILYTYNNTSTAYSHHRLLHELFEISAQRFPDKTAISFDGKEISYAVLNEKSNQIARIIREQGIKKGELIPVFIDRSMEMIMGMLAILKAGGAYVPIEPYLPTARIAKILSQIKAQIIITGAEQLSKLSETEGFEKLDIIISLKKEEKDNYVLPKEMKLVNLDTIFREKIENLSPINSSEDIAYIIFTSGSTGIPKGVQVKHKPVINVLEWVNKKFNVTSDDKLLFVTSIGFDLSVYDIFGTLAAGGTIRLTNVSEQKDPSRIVDIIVNEGITIWDSAPAALQQLMPYISSIENSTDLKLRLAMLSGDWIPLNMPESLKKIFQNIEVLAMGGATEATIWSNYYIVRDQHPNWRSIPYGKPIQNAKYYVLDNLLNTRPIGAPGDLYIGGECLASGYFNDEHLSNSKFIANPYSDGEIIYKTGDLARWMTTTESFGEEGILEFLGRKDAQVKIHGYRIELGEIESCLSKMNSIEEVIVVEKQRGQGDKFICAYYIADSEIDSKIFISHLLKDLSEYMLPAHFIKIDTIPVTANGKLDKNSLPDPEFKDRNFFIAPVSSTEKELAIIWGEVLNLDPNRISSETSFFEMGGHSLNATVLLGKMQRKLLVKIMLVDLFKTPTIKEMAELIEAELWLQDDSERSENILRDEILI